MRHKWNKTKLTYHMCEKCGAKKKLLKSATYQRVWEPSKNDYALQLRRPSEYEYRSPEGKLLKGNPNCVTTNFKKYGSMTNQIELFGKGEVF